MAYDESVAARIRIALSSRRDWSEKKMFGGLCFLVGGHMCCGVLGREIMVRVGKAGFAEAMAQAHARVMDFTGRPSTGMVYVAPAGFSTKAKLARWVGRGLAFVDTLPPKTAKKKTAKKKTAKKKTAKKKTAKKKTAKKKTAKASARGRRP